MFTKIKEAVLSLPVWLCTIVILTIFTIVVILGLIWVVCMIVSGWAIVATVVGYVYWVVYGLVAADRASR